MDLHVSETENSSFTLDNASPIILIGFGVINGLCGLVGLLLNSYLLAVMCYDRGSLDGAVTTVLTQVMAGNLIQIISFCIPVSLTAFAKDWIIGDILCFLLTGLQLIGFSLRWTMIGVYSIHCFCTVFFTFRYPKKSAFVLYVMITLAWIMTITFAFVMIPTNHFVFIINYPVCSINHGKVSFLCISTVLLFIGTAVPTVLFTSLWIKAKMMRKLQLGTIDGDFIETSAILDTIRQQRKSACTLCLMLSISIMSAVVLYINIILGAINTISNNGELLVNFLFTLALSLSPTVDVLFITRNTSIKMSVMKLNRALKGTAFKLAPRRCSFTVTG